MAEKEVERPSGMLLGTPKEMDTNSAGVTVMEDIPILSPIVAETVVKPMLFALSVPCFPIAFSTLSLTSLQDL